VNESETTVSMEGLIDEPKSLKEFYSNWLFYFIIKPQKNRSNLKNNEH